MTTRIERGFVQERNQTQNNPGGGDDNRYADTETLTIDTWAAAATT